MIERKKIRVALDTLGCKVNQAESEQFVRRLVEAGYKVVPFEEEADIYILNTCTVTQTADSKARHWLRTAHRRNPKALLLATGCYAERAAKELTGIEGVKLVVGNTEKIRLVELLNESIESSLRGDPFPHPGDVAISTIPVAPHPLLFHTEQTDNELPPVVRTRAFIKVQDGCHNYCAYCIVPLVRSREESMPAAQVVTEIQKRTAEGYKEIVITGVEVGTYNDGDATLTELLERILAETEIPRLRLSSLQPQEVTPVLIRLWSDPRLCRHFHLSLQSGSDTVLKRMNRRYTNAEYAQAVALIRKAIPDAAITTDIIVGFPSETDKQFAESYEFCKQMDFARIHVFPYSPRQGTAAAKMPSQVADKVKKQRTDRMLALADECLHNFRHKFVGKTLPVLFEQRVNGLWSGLTDNYIRVRVKSGEELTNKIIEVRVEGIGSRD